MKNRSTSLFPLLALLIVFSCGEQQKPWIKEEEVNTPTEPPMETAPTAPVIGERINGPANIREKINGDILFSLNDNTLVSCGELDSNWYEVGVLMEMPLEAFEKDTLYKGQKIIVDGKEVGEVFRDMHVAFSRTNKNSTAYLTGYTHKHNLDEHSIIENALISNFTKVNDRSHEAWLPFIRNFQLEKDDLFKPFTTYFVYEHWVIDPSPLMRIQLIFHEKKLIGVLHARELHLPDTKEYALERDFQVAFFNDTDQELVTKFIKHFNGFINQVD